MDLKRKVFKTNLDGEEVSLEFSDLAGKANGSVLGRYGDTAVLATVVMSKEDKPGDFFPLTVDYEERFYAAGKIIGSRYVRREGRPSDEATLSARLIDRTIRPLFDPRLRREVQITLTVLAYDEKNDPDVIGLLAVSAALAASDVPWGGPVAGVKRISEKPVEEGGFQAFFAGTEKFMNMIEFGGQEAAESAAAAVAVADAAPPVVEEAASDGVCPATSGNQYISIPVTGAPASHPSAALRAPLRRRASCPSRPARPAPRHSLASSGSPPT
ncbi:hypothetical protein M1432_02910, partial [Patescibacteria group bacterium]|nr:hypothetical protein [Patescibacteria group bacterium]